MDRVSAARAVSINATFTRLPLVFATQPCIVGCFPYAPELDKRCRVHLKPTNDSWRVDETYIEVKGEWKVCVAKILPNTSNSVLARRFQPYI
jgi:hypothetical protein